MDSRLDQLCKDVALLFYASMISRSIKAMILVREIFSDLSIDACLTVTQCVQSTQLVSAVLSSTYMSQTDLDNLKMRSRKFTMDVGTNVSPLVIDMK